VYLDSAYEDLAMTTGTPRKLGLFSLSAATFFLVSGGPYGTEGIVESAGYSGAIVILLALPLIWSLPTGLMVGELASAIPAEGGFYVWVRRALGPFWGFQEAWLSLASSIFDMAAYPAVFVLSLGALWPPALNPSNRLWISAALVALCVIWNLAGASAVGEGSIGLGLLLLVPFGILAFLHLTNPAPAAANPGTGHHWFEGVLVAMWNLMGWDNASTVAQEVERPQRNYPKVMLGTLAAIVVVYLLPIVAAWHAGVPQSAWTTGSWVTIAQAAAPQLGTALLVGTMISIFGILNSLTMSYSRIPLALAADGYAPKVLLRHLRNGVPWVSLVVCGLAWTLALRLSFDRILLLDILLYGASLVLEFVALIVLRLREPSLPRPFRIPGGIAGAVGVAIGPTVILAAAFWANRDEQIGEMSALAMALIIMALGIPAYLAAKFVRGRQFVRSS